MGYNLLLIYLLMIRQFSTLILSESFTIFDWKRQQQYGHYVHKSESVLMFSFEVRKDFKIAHTFRPNKIHK